MNSIAKVFIYIEFQGENLPKEKIKELWCSEDVYFSAKGDPVFEFILGKKIEGVRMNDYCNIRFELQQYKSSVNDILTGFLLREKENISYISSNYIGITKKIHICIYPVSQQYTFELSAELMNLLLLLELEVGATILQLG